MEFISYYTEDDEIRAVATVNKDAALRSFGLGLHLFLGFRV